MDRCKVCGVSIDPHGDCACEPEDVDLSLCTEQVLTCPLFKTAGGRIDAPVCQTCGKQRPRRTGPTLRVVPRRWTQADLFEPDS